MPDEVFLSHSSSDREIATTIANVLRQHGIPVWYSDTDIRGSQQWQDEIGDALRRCDWFSVLLTPDSVQSTWVRREVAYALNQPSLENRIVPVIIEDCDHEQLSWVLGTIHIVDFRDGLKSGSRRLLRVWGKGLREDVVDRLMSDS